ncbi:MAG: hypothetical protein GY757_17655 [bacterium]|nr:hypothetical protein [bacterium]
MSLSLSVGLARKMKNLEPELKDVFYSFIEEQKNRVDKTDFNELSGTSLKSSGALK